MYFVSGSWLNYSLSVLLHYLAEYEYDSPAHYLAPPKRIWGEYSVQFQPYTCNEELTTTLSGLTNGLECASLFWFLIQLEPVLVTGLLLSAVWTANIYRTIVRLCIIWRLLYEINTWLMYIIIYCFLNGRISESLLRLQLYIDNACSCGRFF